MFGHPASGPQGGDRSAAAAQLIGAMDRLQQVVDAETRTLREHNTADLQAFSHRKSQGLLEVSRSMRALGDAPPDPAVRARLLGLRASLADNHALLGLHLRAAQEISTTLSRALEHAESDGTYSARFR
jgi:hypothetical protein